MVEHVAGTYAAPRSEIAAVEVVRKRLSWGAVIAGVIIVLVVQLLLSLLGVGIGASTIDPLGETPSGATLGIGASVWWVVSALLAVFAGSWVAARLAGEPARSDGMLHGVVTWGLATLFTLYLLTTALSGLLGGAFGVVGSALQTVGQGAAAGVTAGVTTQTGGANDPLARIEQQIDQALMAISPEARQAAGQMQQALGDENVRRVIERVVTAGPDRVTPGDREAAIKALVDHAGMSRPQAEQKLAEWEQTYRQAEQQTREAAQAAAEAVSAGSLWSFVTLALGGIVAAVGGMLGAPRYRAAGIVRPRSA